MARRTYASETRKYTDPATGVEITQLTDWHAHTHHLYFTCNGLWDGGRRLLVASQRANSYNLFSVDLHGGEIAQLTDLPRTAAAHLIQTDLCHGREEAYFTVGGAVTALDLRRRRSRVLYEVPAGFRPGNVSCTADGRFLCMAICEDLSGRVPTDLMHGYVGFTETFEAHPLCRVLGIPIDGGPPEVLHEEREWIGHVNASPTRAHLVTFCHEGPWHRLQRMWLLNTNGREVWPLRPQAPGEAVGHEYWYADGVRVGYHGWKDPATPVYGFVRWDGTDVTEWPAPGGSMHYHSMDEHLVVGDGGRDTPYLLLWRTRQGVREGPRRLAWHRCSFHTQYVHAHPRVFRDAGGRTKVVYTSDHNGYGNVFVATVPEFESLPRHAAEADAKG